jgi:hypothetical protein
VEAIIAAAVTGLCSVVAVIVSNRNQSSKTRKAGLDQHTEQNSKLDVLIRKQDDLSKAVDDNKKIAAKGLAELTGKVDGVIATTDTLFNMIVDVDAKVTKPANKRVAAARPVPPVTTGSVYERGQGGG